MAEFDPLVANGITYAPIKDIVMSDAPIYGVEPYRGNPMIAGSQAVSLPPSKPDEFVPQNKKSSSWWKWALGIGGAIVGIVGLKKGYYKPSKIKGLFQSGWNKVKKCIPFGKKKTVPEEAAEDLLNAFSSIARRAEGK